MMSLNLQSLEQPSEQLLFFLYAFVRDLRVMTLYYIPLLYPK